MPPHGETNQRPHAEQHRPENSVPTCTYKVTYKHLQGTYKHLQSTYKVPTKHLQSTYVWLQSTYKVPTRYLQSTYKYLARPRAVRVVRADASRVNLPSCLAPSLAELLRVTCSQHLGLGWLHSGIVEVQLPIEAKLKNIEETERAKRRCMATVAQSLVLLCFEKAQHTQLRIHSATASPQPQPELQRSRWRPLSATAHRARCWVKQRILGLLTVGRGLLQQYNMLQLQRVHSMRAAAFWKRHQAPRKPPTTCTSRQRL